MCRVRWWIDWQLLLCSIMIKMKNLLKLCCKEERISLAQMKRTRSTQRTFWSYCLIVLKNGLCIFNLKMTAKVKMNSISNTKALWIRELSSHQRSKEAEENLLTQWVHLDSLSQIVAEHPISMVKEEANHRWRINPPREGEAAPHHGGIRNLQPLIQLIEEIEIWGLKASLTIQSQPPAPLLLIKSHK